MSRGAEACLTSTKNPTDTTKFNIYGAQEVYETIIDEFDPRPPVIATIYRATRSNMLKSKPGKGKTRKYCLRDIAEWVESGYRTAPVDEVKQSKRKRDRASAELGKIDEKLEKVSK